MHQTRVELGDAAEDKWCVGKLCGDEHLITGWGVEFLVNAGVVTWINMMIVNDFVKIEFINKKKSIWRSIY